MKIRHIFDKTFRNVVKLKVWIIWEEIYLLVTMRLTDKLSLWAAGQQGQILRYYHGIVHTTVCLPRVTRDT